MRYTKANEEKLFKWLSKAISNDRFFYSVQPGGKLGTRISTCFEDAFLQGCDKVVICGNSSIEHLYLKNSYIVEELTYQVK